MHAETTLHLVAVKRILRFLKGTITFGLHLGLGTLHAILRCWLGRTCNWLEIYKWILCLFWPKSSFMVCQEAAHCGPLFHWSKYRRLAHTNAKISWLCTLLQDLKIFLHYIPLIWCGNTSTIFLASNPIFHARTKHIEMDYHYIHEKVQEMIQPFGLYTVKTKLQMSSLRVFHLLDLSLFKISCPSASGPLAWRGVITMARLRI